MSAKKKAQLYQPEVDAYRPIFRNNASQMENKMEKEISYSFLEELLATQTALPWTVQLKIVRQVCFTEVKESQKSLVDLDMVDVDSLMAERIAREEMRNLELTFDFYKFVEISRKVAYFQTFNEISLSQSDAIKRNKKKMPVAIFVQQPQLTTSWGQTSLYDSTIQPQNIMVSTWQTVSTAPKQDNEESKSALFMSAVEHRIEEP